MADTRLPTAASAGWEPWRWKFGDRCLAGRVLAIVVRAGLEEPPALAGDEAAGRGCRHVAPRG